MQAHLPNPHPQRFITSHRLHHSLIWPPQPASITFTYMNTSANRKNEGVFKNVHLIDSKQKPLHHNKQSINPQQNYEQALKQADIQIQIRQEIECLTQQLQGLVEENRTIMKQKRAVQQIMERSTQQMAQLTYCLERNVIKYQIDLQTIKQRLNTINQSNHYQKSIPQ